MTHLRGRATHLLTALALLSGCAAHHDAASAAMERAEYAFAGEAAGAPAPSAGGALYADAGGDATPAATSGGRTTAPTATDAVDPSRQLLIYTANFHLAVFEVRRSQETILAATRELGGFLFAQSDDRLVVRVPAARFDELVGRIEQAGDVIRREVQAQDVGEEFHDIAVRIRNLEAMRQRVEEMLARASRVEDALAVEQELRRITQELEVLRGRQRFLADRVAFSTITVFFRVQAEQGVDQSDVPVLPFPWLDQLGLRSLLSLQ